MGALNKLTGGGHVGRVAVYLAPTYIKEKDVTILYEQDCLRYCKIGVALNCIYHFSSNAMWCS